MKPNVYLALPTYDARLRYDNVVRIVNQKVTMHSESSSFLTYGFNRFWANALNNPDFTHFVMLHDDIVPQVENWIDILLEEMNTHRLDVLSAVSPLKWDWGITSTALCRTPEYTGFRRLTMQEIKHSLPPTFTKHEVANLFGWPAPNARLLTNTGCFMVKLHGNRPQLEQLCFGVNNWLVRGPDNKFTAVSEPEDWKFSREAANLNLRVGATTKVPLIHYGWGLYNNYQDWGTVEHDTEVTPFDPQGAATQ